MQIVEILKARVSYNYKTTAFFRFAVEMEISTFSIPNAGKMLVFNSIRKVVFLRSVKTSVL